MFCHGGGGMGNGQNIYSRNKIKDINTFLLITFKYLIYFFYNFCYHKTTTCREQDLRCRSYTHPAKPNITSNCRHFELILNKFPPIKKLGANSRNMKLCYLNFQDNICHKKTVKSIHIT